VWLHLVIAYAGFIAISNMEGGYPFKGFIQELLVGTSEGVKELLPIILLIV
jgi:hypothetical protein